MALWETNYDEEDEDSAWGSSGVDFSELTGGALYRAAEEICLDQVPAECDGDMTLLRNMYSRQITSDCKGYENSIAAKKAEAELALADANADVRAALKESFDEDEITINLNNEPEDIIEESIPIEDLLANCDVCSAREVEVPKVVGE